MNTYICKCGKTFQKSSNADSTGYVLKNFDPQHECYGCPYIVTERDWITQEIKKQECRATPKITYVTRCCIGTEDRNFKACHLYTLDLDFAKKVLDFIKSLDGATKGDSSFNPNTYPKEWRAADFGLCYDFDDCCGLAIFPLCFQNNKKGTEARRTVMNRFFYSDGTRKDISSDDEKQHILWQIENAKKQAKSRITNITEECSMSSKFDLGAMLKPSTVNTEYAKAAEVHAEIINYAKMAQENLYQMALGFKKMRDEKLYMALGYDNFAEYCEKETGMKRGNVYKYIAVAEKLPQEFVSPVRQIGVQKLYLLTTITEDEREEIAETIDLESSTVKELKSKIDELKNKNDELERSRSELEEAQSSEMETYKNRISELERAINEFENKPIEVAVQDNEDEINRLKAELVQLQREKQELLMGEQERDDLLIAFKAAYKNAQTALNTLQKECIKYADFGGYSDAITLCNQFSESLKELKRERFD